MKSKIIGIILLGIAIALFGLVMYYNNPNREIPIVFSPRTMLSGLWHTYTETTLEKDTLRTLDAERDYITTSEGQSYTMIRAVWMDDKEIFDRSWTWTKDNLQHDDDTLLAWLFGKRPDGTYGVVTSEGGGNTASDADSDIALALVFAYSRWGDKTYLGDARALVKDIWDKEVILIGGKPYLAANNVEKTTKDPWVLLNPSYFAPYAYRVFKQIDPEHDWIGLIDTSYDIIERSITEPLDMGTGVLPPDWIEIHAKTGELRAPTRGDTLKSTYSYDAIRIPFRLALDYEWYGDERVRAVLAKMDFLGAAWKRDMRLKAGYSHRGEPIFDFESPAMYGGSLGYFIVMEPESAAQIYKQKLETLYDPDVQGWRQAPGYYDSNIVWFGLALYNHALPNLAERLNLENI